MDALESKRILRLPQVCDLTGRKRSSIYELMKQGLFPQSVSLGGRLIGWRAGDIAAYLDRLGQPNASGSN